jgi:hypothetical protein
LYNASMMWLRRVQILLVRYHSVYKQDLEEVHILGIMFRDFYTVEIAETHQAPGKCTFTPSRENVFLKNTSALTSESPPLLLPAFPLELTQGPCIARKREMNYSKLHLPARTGQPIIGRIQSKLHLSCSNHTVSITPARVRT